ncbi:YodC family protein [Burkholderia ambifaria]|uniref:YodC family protein n=1 Tax=Burkholderia ambifaria TaxID=152480 RepID=UPI00158C9551|nr:YodC family protein [Burkholderia ambifaria]
MALKFKIGDIVQLKSGGPEMTVQTLPYERNSRYRCQWFAGKKLESGEFPEESLMPVQPKAE